MEMDTYTLCKKYIKNLLLFTAAVNTFINLQKIIQSTTDSIKKSPWGAKQAKNFPPPFMELKASILCSQEPTTGTYI